MVYLYQVISKDVRRIIESDNPKEIGDYKCSCGVIIKNEKNIEKHLKTKSHNTRLYWKEMKYPTYIGTLLTTK